MRSHINLPANIISFYDDSEYAIEYDTLSRIIIVWDASNLRIKSCPKNWFLA